MIKKEKTQKVTKNVKKMELNTTKIIKSYKGL